MSTKHDGGYLFEQGPTTVPADSPTFRRLTSKMGLLDRLVLSSPSASLRLIYAHGRLHPVPMKPLEFLTSRLLSTQAKVRLLSEPLRTMRTIGPLDPEPSLKEFLVDRLGSEAATVLGGAFIRGVYAAELKELGARSALPRVFHLANDNGGILRGLLKARKDAKRSPNEPLPGVAAPRGSLASFPQGLSELPFALAKQLGQRIHLGKAATGIEHNHKGWTVTVEGGTHFQARAIVLATGPTDAHALLSLIIPDHASIHQLKNVQTANITVVQLGLCEAALPPAFGFLVPPGAQPAKCAPRLLGALFPSNIFGGRAPSGGAVVNAIYHTQTLAGLNINDAIQFALEDLRRGLGREPGKLSTAHLRHWKGVIPRYSVGHDKEMADLHGTLRQTLPNLVMAGTWHGGVSVEDRLKAGIEAAAQASFMVGSPQGIYPEEADA